MEPTYMAQWSLAYQRQITPNWLLSLSYLGNKTTHIWTSQDINPAQYIPGNTASTNLRRKLYLQNPTLGAAYGLIEQSDQNGNGNYNGLLVSIQHRFNRGFTLLTNYTWSHCLSDADHTQSLQAPQYEQTYNRAGDYGNCNFDIRHQSNTSLVALSPFTGKSLVARVFGQWQLAPIFSIRSGLPMNITTGTDVSQTGINLDRPNVVVPNAVYLNGSDPTHYLNPAAFAPAAAGTYGNLGRNVLIGPGAINFDLSLSRNFRIKERYELTPRVEAFNVINHPNFGAPVTVLTSSQFGVITGSSQVGLNGSVTSASAGDPRIFQFALKLQF
jgi:hypothetical protein